MRMSRCLKGHLPIVKLLVGELSVDCERTNSNGASPLYVAVSNWRPYGLHSRLISVPIFNPR